MLKGPLIHPQILSALGRAGHGSKVLLSDGNYPHATKRGRHAEVVYLNLAPGQLSVTEVLGPLLQAISVEAAAVMAPQREGPYAMQGDPPIFAEFDAMLTTAGFDQPLDRLERFDFYTAAAADDVALTIATGEQRIYANLLLTIGVVQ